MIRTDWARGAVVALACLSTAACTDGFLHEPAAVGNARVAIVALQGVDGAQEAFDKADRLQIRVTDRDGGRLLYEGAVPVSAGGGPIRASLDIDLSGRPVDAAMEVGVRRGGDDLFLGGDQFTLIPGEESQVSLELRPVPSGLDVSEIPQFTTFGQTFPLEGRVLFATGDEIPSAEIEWSSQTPDVLAVREAPGGGWYAEAIADGQGAVTAAFETVSASVPAPVRAVVVSAEMAPSTVTLRRGESVELVPTYFDAGGSPVPGRTSEWASTDAGVAEVDDTGRVLAVSVGQVDVSATHEGVSAVTLVNVSDPPGVGTVGTRSVTPTGGTVGGTVTPQGLPTTVWFEYGRDPQLSDAVETPRQSRSGLAPSEVVASLTGLLPGTTYYFRILAENALGRTVSDIYSFTTPGVLATPTGLSAQLVPPSAIRIGWTDNSVGETRFEIERTAGGGPGTVVGSVGPDVTSWTDPAPPLNTTAYRVRACDDDACSAWSASVAPPGPGTGNPPPPPPGPPTVASLPTTFPSLGSARLGAAVSAAGSATTVRFEYGTDPQLAGAAQTPSRLLNPDAVDASVFVTVAGLAPGATVYARATATNSDGSTSGPIVSFTLPMVPAAPANFAAAGDGYGGVRLTWVDASADETGFELQREALSGGQISQFAIGADREVYIDTSPPVGTVRYRLRACNAVGCSAWSAWATWAGAVTPPPAAPSSLTVTLLPGGGLRLDWVDNSGGGATTQIERMETVSGTTIVVPVGAGTNQYTDASPPTGLLEYRVRSCNGGSCSPWSAPVQSWYGLAPQITLGAATNIGLTSADLSADVTAFQAPTTVVFRLSTDPSFTSSTVLPTIDAGAGASSQLVTVTAAGLDDGVVYYVRAQATNLWGTTVSGTGSFTTAGGGG
jgi:hypothetical protein